VLRAEQSIVLLFTLRAQELSEYQVRCSWGEDARKYARHRPAQAAPALPGEGGQAPRQIAAAEPQAGKPRDDLAADYRRASLATTKEAGGVELTDVTIDEEQVPCPGLAPCALRYTVKARLLNNSAGAVAGLALGIGLYWANQGQLPVIPERGMPATPNEKVMRFEDLSLPPGASKALRIHLDRDVPIVPGGAFVPHLRVLEFQNDERTQNG
jgi:hypothetical protein